MTLPPFDQTHGETAIRRGRIVQVWRLKNGEARRDEEHMHRVLCAWYGARQAETAKLLPKREAA